MTTTKNQTPPAVGKTAHTPTPWTVMHSSLNEDQVRSSAGYFIADCEQQYGGKAKGIANAAFIVRACNSHAGLCAAIEESILYLDAAGLTDKADRIRNLVAELIAAQEANK
jgi:hypothetical protein